MEILLNQSRQRDFFPARRKKRLLPGLRILFGGKDMKKATRLLALLLAALMVLTACGGGGETTPPAADDGGQSGETTPADDGITPVTDWYTWQLQGTEIETFLIFNSEVSSTLEVLTACNSPLLERNGAGQLVPAAAKEWGSEDGGITWTFKLRDDITWVDVDGNEKAKTVAHDWLTGLEWVLNFHKNGGANTSMPNLLVKGAQEYYDYTHDLDEAEALALSADNGPFLEMVGIEAPDDYTLVYTCPNNAPYFETLCFGAALRPLSQAQVDEMGVSGIRSMDNTDMWYNGAYVITEYIQGNTTVLERNPSYWDKDCTLFDSVTYVTVEDNVRAQDLFMNGEVDWCNVTEATLQTIYEDPSDEWYPYLVEARPTPYSYQAHLNYAKNKEDGTPDDNWNNAVANEAFRLSLLYGLDLTKFWARTNFINPASCENVAYTMTEMMYYPDGRDYVQAVWDRLGYKSGRYDAEKGKQYKEQAMQELAGKVTFPVEVDYYIAGGNQSSLDSATVLKEVFESLGTDYITMNIKTYVSSFTKEVTIPRLQSFAISGWGADYRDPDNFLGQEIMGADSAYYACNYANINDATDPELLSTWQTFTDMTVAASQIYDDITKRYDAYADAEAFMIEHALVIPVRYQITWKLTKSNDYDAMETFKNWHTSTTPYTTEQYEQFKADFYAK